MRALGLALVCLVACSSSKTANVLPAEAWTAADYVKAGVPAIDHTWTIDEHEAAAAALTTAVSGHRERLPQLGGAKSGPVFMRIVEWKRPVVSPDAGELFLAHARRFEVANAISKLYVVDETAAANPEYLALAALLLREGVVLDAAADAFLASFGADDPKRENRLAGLQRMRMGWGRMVYGGVTILADARVPEPARVTLAKEITDVLPAMYPHFEPAAQKMIRDELEHLHATKTLGEPLRAALPPVP